MTARAPDAAPCLDCGTDTCCVDRSEAAAGVAEWYMVLDEVWAAAGLGYRRFCCIGCLETRLGRRLHSADFTTAPVNEPVLNHQSARLTDRIMHTADGALDPLRDRVEIVESCERPGHGPGPHECFVPGLRCPHGHYLLYVQDQPDVWGDYTCEPCLPADQPRPTGAHDDAYYAEDF